jgi:hypothetical protein
MRSLFRSTTAAAVLCCSAFLASTSQAATLVVNLTGDLGDGTCDASCTLRDAVTGAQLGDTIALGSLSVVLTQGPLVVTRNLTFTGVGASIGGGGTQQLLQVTAGTVSFSGITFTGGTSAGTDGVFGGADGGMGGMGSGGALWVGSGTDVTVDGCTFLSNQAIGGRGANAPAIGSGNGGAGGGAGLAALRRAPAGSAHSPASTPPRGETQTAFSQMRSPLQSVSFEQPARMRDTVRLSTGAPFESGDVDAADGGSHAAVSPIGVLRGEGTRGGPAAFP